jgi:hypothetical protein
MPQREVADSWCPAAEKGGFGLPREAPVGQEASFERADGETLRRQLCSGSGRSGRSGNGPCAMAKNGANTVATCVLLPVF